MRSFQPQSRHVFVDAFLVSMLSALLVPSVQAACWDEAAKRYAVNRDILRSISYVESKFNATAINDKNNNGSVDVCHMQINSVHLKTLTQQNISQQTLLDKPCVCTEFGAWVLAHCTNKFGQTWEAVGCCNAGMHPNRRSLRARYAKKVHAAYTKLTTH